MYNVVITEYAIRQLKKINKQMVALIREAIAELAQNPRPHNHIKLTNLEAYRVRVGNYRIIYEINDSILTVIVVEVADRKQGYKKKQLTLFFAPTASRQRLNHRFDTAFALRLCWVLVVDSSLPSYRKETSCC